VQGGDQNPRPQLAQDVKIREALHRCCSFPIDVYPFLAALKLYEHPRDLMSQPLMNGEW
jgi:hypothetical protein